MTLQFRIFLAIALLYIIYALPAHAQKPRFKVAAFYSTKGEMDHVNFAKDALYFFDLIAGQQDFTFDATTDWTNLNDNYLANYNIILWLNDAPHTDEERAAFERYTNRGGAWIGFHAAGFNLPDAKWKWFNTFLGGAYFHANNWPPLPAKLIVEDRKHPITLRLPETYISPTGEWYQWKPSPRENKNVKVLLSLAPENYPLGVKSFITGGDTPVVWTNTQYRMLYVNMGHSNKIFSNTDQKNMIIDAILWFGGATRKEIKNWWE